MSNSTSQAHILQKDIRVRYLDVAAARQYFAGLESLAREARVSRDPRVLLAALAVMRRQPATVSGLVRGRL